MTEKNLKRRPIALIILDGVGEAPHSVGNAVTLARTPFLDQYRSRYPRSLIESSGERVGLPPGMMGSSEVGHLNIGAGRIVPLEITRIDQSITTGKFDENPMLSTAIDHGRHTALHLIGLLSDGGVHSSIEHLYALLRLAARREVPRVFIHAITDGRDTPQHSGLGYLEDLQARCAEYGVGRVATICGRYYAMDRDNRWERTRRAYDLLTAGAGGRFADPRAALAASYQLGVTDEFVEPAVIADEPDSPLGVVRPGDSVIFFNFRADRARQLTRAFTGRNFDGFRRTLLPELHFATFTQYDRSFTTPILFPPIAISNTLGEVFAAHGITNLRLAETEKYAHVTYFFNGGVEREFPCERRILIPSPPVANYDERPGMNAFELTTQALRALDEGETDVFIINYANADMVGHTGNLKATVEAVENLDTCLGRLVGALERLEGVAMITSDHGNAEQMIAPETGAPHTAHTSNPAPFILCDPTHQWKLREVGALEDIAPTLLALLGISPPPEMTGDNLIIDS